MYDNPLLPNQNNYMQGISASMNAPSQNSMPQQVNNLNNLQPLGELIRQQGGEEDTILAHINPLEAQMLKQMGGSGHINPTTGLPSFSIFTNPLKAIGSSLGGGGGAIIGNMLMPGIGGIIGGALGQGLQNTARGKSFGQGALKGGLMGAALPSVAGLAGMGANSLGMTGAGNFLTNYGTQNAILPSLGFGAQGMGAGVAAGSAAMPEVALSSLTNNVAIPQAASLGGAVAGAGAAGTGAAGAGSLAANAAAQAPTFWGKLAANTSDLLSNPLGIMAAATALGSLAGRPKAESPEKQASKEKRLTKARRLTAQERAEKEADELADRQMERRIARNQYLPEEMFTINPLYRHVNSPEQYRQTGRWMNYNNIPNYA